MGISFDEAAKAQAALEDNLLKDPNIVSIGVVKEINGTGEKTGNYVVQVGVVSSEVYQNALRKGAQPIPAEYVLTPEKGSTLEGGKHIRIQVVQMEQIQALHATSFNSTFPFGMIRRNYCTTPLLPQDRMSRVIPKEFHSQRNHSTFCLDRLEQHAIQTLSRLTQPDTDKAVHIREKPPVPTLTFKYQPKPNAALQVLESLRRVKLPRIML